VSVGLLRRNVSKGGMQERIWNGSSFSQACLEKAFRTCWFTQNGSTRLEAYRCIMMPSNDFCNQGFTGYKIFRLYPYETPDDRRLTQRLDQLLVQSQRRANKRWFFKMVDAQSRKVEIFQMLDIILWNFKNLHWLNSFSTCRKINILIR